MRKFKIGDLIRHKNQKHKEILEIVGIARHANVAFAYQVYIMSSNLGGLIYFEDEDKYQNVFTQFSKLWTELNGY